MKTLTIRVAGTPDDPMLPAEALSLLMGVPVDDIRAQGLSSGTCVTTLPTQWMQAGRRRALEAQAHTGSDDMVSGLEYWAEKDHGARLRIIYTGVPGGGGK